MGSVNLARILLSFEVDVGLTDFRRRVGIVGLAWSGKTVFLTSLLEHLRHHEVSRFRLGSPEEPAEIRRFEEVEVSGGIPRFNLESHLDALRHQGGWPAKTTDAALFRCRFKRSDRVRTQDLSFLDFPGERIADAAMADGDYAAWSDYFIKLFNDDSRYHAHAAEFLALQRTDVEPRPLIDAYRLALGRLVCDYAPLISPSVFLLDRQGQVPQERTPEAIAAERLVGLDSEHEFVPLSAEVRAARPALAAQFSARFDAYREAIPKPLFEALASCHRLVILVDVAGTLAANVGRFNDAQTIIDSLIQSSTPDRGVLSRIGMFLAGALWPEAWRPKGISRIAFVATKADLVAEADVAHLGLLLGEMVPRAARDRSVRIACFECSALVSTESEEGRLLGYPAWTPDGLRTTPPGRDDPAQFLAPSAVPESWPDAWKEGDFVFPEVWPLMPQRQGQPPPQTGLDRVLAFLLDETLAE